MTPMLMVTIYSVNFDTIHIELAPITFVTSFIKCHIKNNKEKKNMKERERGREVVENLSLNFKLLRVFSLS